MPIWLRKFYIKKLIETKKLEKKAREESNEQSTKRTVVRK